MTDKPMSAEELPSLEQLTDDLWHLAHSGSLYKTEQRMRAKIDNLITAIRAAERAKVLAELREQTSELILVWREDQAQGRSLETSFHAMLAAFERGAPKEGE